LGLLDYYRQFDDMDQEELNRERRERRAREKALALEQVPTVDLSGTEWPNFPNSEIMNAAIAVARGRVNGYPDRLASAVRSELAADLGVEPEQIVVGNGAAELLQSAASALLAAGGELVTLLVGAHAPQGLAEDVLAHVRQTRRDVDTVVYDGGQPRYPLLIGVE